MKPEQMSVLDHKEERIRAIDALLVVLRRQSDDLAREILAYEEERERMRRHVHSLRAAKDAIGESRTPSSGGTKR